MILNSLFTYLLILSIFPINEETFSLKQTGPRLGELIKIKVNFITCKIISERGEIKLNMCKYTLLFSRYHQLTNKNIEIPPPEITTTLPSCHLQNFKPIYE